MANDYLIDYGSDPTGSVSNDGFFTGAESFLGSLLDFGKTVVPAVIQGKTNQAVANANAQAQIAAAQARSAGSFLTVGNMAIGAGTIVLIGGAILLYVLLRK